MSKVKLIRITTVPLSLEKLLEGQLSYMSQFYDITAVSSEEQRLKAYGEKEGVKTHYIPLTRKITPIKDLRALLLLFRFLRKNKPQIVHTHTPKAGIIGMMAAYFARVPIRMHTVAGLPLMEATGLKRDLLNFIEKLTYKFATQVYPNSSVLKQFIEAEKFADSSKLRMIGEGSSNGIDTNYFSNSHFSAEAKKVQRKALSIPENDLVYIFVGRLVRDKGINELVHAFECLNKRHNDTVLLLVGPYEDELDPLMSETKSIINTHPKIRAIGFQNDVRVFMAISDVLTFPSYREGFPNVVLQAGAMGLPLLVSDINGCNEIVTQNINGLIVPVKNGAALQEAMFRILKDTDFRETSASSSRSIITTNYERRKIWKLLHEEYEALIHNM